MKGGDVGCGGKQCYTVTTQLTAEDLGGVAGHRPPDRHRGCERDIEIRVEKELPNHLAGLTVTLTLPDTDPVVVDVAFSKWDEAVTIDRAAGGPGRGRVSPPTYNGRVSPTRRRRTGDPTLDDAAAAAAEAVGTAFADLDDDAVVPDEPGVDARVPDPERKTRPRPSRPPDPAASQARREAACRARSSAPSTRSRRAP